MGTQAPPGLTLIAPRQTAAGSSGEALSDLIVDQLPNGALCFVTAEQALYRLDKNSSAPPDGSRVIVTGRGASARGRWVQTSGNASVAPLQTLIWCDAHFVGTSTGSISAPFRTLQEAIDVVPEDGATILMTLGEYEDPWAVPEGMIVNVFGLSAAQGASDGNVELVEGTLGNNAAVRLDSVALDGDLTLSGSGALYCSNVAFYSRDIIQDGPGGWDIRIGGDSLAALDLGTVTAAFFVAAGFTLQRQINVSGTFARITNCIPEQNIVFTGAAGVLLTDLFTLNAMRGHNSLIVNGDAVAVDAPTNTYTIASPVFGAAGLQTVDVAFANSRQGDTFVITNTSALPTGVFLGVPTCTADNVVTVVLGAFGAALGGNVDIAITRFIGQP